MASGPYQHLTNLAERAQSLAPAQRAQFLDTACASAAERTAVESLLAANAQVGGASPSAAKDSAPTMTLATAAPPSSAQNTLTQAPLQVPAIPWVAAPQSPRAPEAPPGAPRWASAPSDFVASRSAETSEVPGAQIGHYKLLQRIGEGGFGAVWMAEQREPVKRKVALKIIKLGMDTRQVIARFEQERQALALMDHPNIARVLDAGATATGRPYFVMELVKGVPITDYCDQAGGSTAERLALFISVCQAVQHAHTKGIIHRDIKPSNVLVTLHDGQPVPKVIDFGIAKAMNAELTERTLFTEHKQMIGTPLYMSPEQAEMSGLDIDTRSDVYSLGVLLYELLTGTTPLDGERLAAVGYAEMLRIIREEEPLKPSTRLSTLGPARAKVAKQQGTDARRIDTLVRGELDWIVMKCLEKDRRRRYETPSALAEDVQRHLAGEAVLAVPPSAAYRLKKFVRRNRVAVITGGAVVAALVGGVGVAATGMVWAMQARDAERNARVAEQQQREKTAAALEQATANEARAQQSAQRADAQAAAAKQQQQKAQFVAAFMQQMLAGAQPSIARGRDTTMLREMMDNAAERIAAGELQDAPEAELALRLVIGDTYGDIAAFDDAESMLRGGLDLARRLPTDTSHATLTALSGLTTLVRERGRLEEAAALGGEALALARRSGNDEYTLEALNDQALVHQARGEVAAAEALFREALPLAQRLSTGDHPRLAAALNNLGMLLRDRDAYAEARPLLEAGVAMNRRLARGDSPELARALNNLGILLQQQGEHERAETLLRESLQMQEHVGLGEHPDHAVGLVNLAFALTGRGEFEAAEPPLTAGVAALTRIYGEQNATVANALSNLGMLAARRGDFDFAEQTYRKALAIQRAVLPKDHPAVADTLNNLAGLLFKRGQPEQVEPLLREAVRIYEAALQPDDPKLLNSRMGLGLRLAARREYGEAATLLSGVHAAASKNGALMETQLVRIAQALAKLYEDWDVAAPNQGHAAQAATWRAKTEAIGAAPGQ